MHACHPCLLHGNRVRTASGRHTNRQAVLGQNLGPVLHALRHGPSIADISSTCPHTRPFSVPATRRAAGLRHPRSGEARALPRELARPGATCQRLWIRVGLAEREAPHCRSEFAGLLEVEAHTLQPGSPRSACGEGTRSPGQHAPHLLHGSGELRLLGPPALLLGAGAGEGGPPHALTDRAHFLCRRQERPVMKANGRRTKDARGHNSRTCTVASHWRGCRLASCCPVRLMLRNTPGAPNSDGKLARRDTATSWACPRTKPKPLWCAPATSSWSLHRLPRRGRGRSRQNMGAHDAQAWREDLTGHRARASPEHPHARHKLGMRAGPGPHGRDEL